MSTTTDAAVEVHPVEDEHVHEHPSDLKYVKIALLLGVITAAEVATYFFEMSTTALVAFLFPMMIAKFAIVAGYFMHLKYDNPLFKRVFVFGLALAVAVFVITLFAFEFWSDDFFRHFS